MANIEDLDRIEDPIERAREAGRRLNLVPPWQSQLRQIRQDAIKEMRGNGMSWADIGRELGMHRNRAQQIGEGRTGGNQGEKADEA